MNICLVTPAPPGSRAGNRASANRWAAILRRLGHRVNVSTDYRGEPADLMVGLHAKLGHSLLRNWNLPKIYCDIALKHHAEEYDRQNTPLMVVKLANQACNKLGIGLDADPEIMLAATPEAYSLGLSEVGLAELVIKLEDFVGRLGL